MLEENTSAQENPVPTERISDEAVQAKTGKNWESWFRILDAAGAQRMGHSEIARYLHEQHEVEDWWCQMVTVTYEQARGLREKHQRPDGYSVSASRTVRLPVETLFQAWEDEASRRRWLSEDGLTVRKVNPPKSIRITWSDGKTSLEIYFTPMGESKAQVAVQHSKLPDRDAAARMKEYWGGILDRMREVLEG